MASVYRPLSSLSPHCTRSSHREFLDLSDRIPSLPHFLMVQWERERERRAITNQGEILAIVKIPASPTWSFFFLFFFFFLMVKKHSSPVIHITLQKRRGIDCVGKQSWEVEEKRGVKKRRPFSCCACGLRGYQASLSLIRFLAAQTHHLHGDGRRQGKKKTALLIQRRVIFSPVVELLTDVAWQQRERERERERE